MIFETSGRHDMATLEVQEVASLYSLGLLEPELAASLSGTSNRDAMSANRRCVVSTPPPLRWLILSPKLCRLQTSVRN